MHEITVDNLYVCMYVNYVLCHAVLCACTFGHSFAGVCALQKHIPNAQTSLRTPFPIVFNIPEMGRCVAVYAPTPSNINIFVVANAHSTLNQMR